MDTDLPLAKPTVFKLGRMDDWLVMSPVEHIVGPELRSSVRSTLRYLGKYPIQRRPPFLDGTI